ncbi:helix-turn-helix domain-containing protein [Arsenicicoccus bolidensis]|uniref:helix-turn-helix domain-containing protein n=1 Tax=Arsenicicoccus bolidensis TaxID=229480 RepID=UPI003558262A
MSLPDSRTSSGLGACSTAEAAAQLGVTVPTVIRWVRDGFLTGEQEELGRRAWLVDVASVQDALTARGGPGARRGRPVGSVSAVASEVAALRRRVESLEQQTGDVDAPTASALVVLVRLLQADSSDRRAQSEAISQAARSIEELLHGAGASPQPATH